MQNNPDIDIYKMELHDKAKLDDYTSILKVHGGWIYTDWVGFGDNITITKTFIPWIKADIVRQES